MTITNSLKVQLKRINKLLSELETEYDKCLGRKKVSSEAEVITHEIIEKISNILDQAARRIWEKYLVVGLSESDKKKAIVYFPKAKDRQSFDSTLGRWRVKNIESNFPVVFNFFLKKQPFYSEKNMWLHSIGRLASQKHIGLVPQKREEVTHIKISSEAGTVHLISERVKFGSGVSILGAPVDPNTQRIKPTSGVEEKVEKWISFVLQDYNLDALNFCKESYNKAKQIVEESFLL